MIIQSRFIPLLFCLSLLGVQSARAELGGTVNKTAVLVQDANPSVKTDARLRVFQISGAGGTLIKEYVDTNNTVVAVTWQGPTLPDLKSLLGPHFQTFSDHAHDRAANRNSAGLVTDDLVVQSQGRMRNFAGRAYLPKLLPAGVDLKQIQ